MIFTKYTITKEGITIHSGVIQQSIKTIQFDKINDIEISLNIIQKSFEVGNIFVHTSHETKTKLSHIKDPYQFKKILLKFKD